MNPGNESGPQEELIVSEEEGQGQDKEDGSDDEYAPGEVTKKQSTTKRQRTE